MIGVFPRRSAVRLQGSAVLIVGLAVVVALFFGFVIAVVGGIASTLIFVGLVGLAGVLANFRIGVWLAVALLPFAATQLMPRQILGVIGLNPLNILLAVTFCALLFETAFGKCKLIFPVLPWILVVYLTLIFIGAARGVLHADSAISTTLPDGSHEPLTKIKYLLDAVFKPVLILVVAWLAAILSLAGQGQRLLWAVVLSAGIYFSLVAGFLLLSGFQFQSLAGSNSRGFLSWMGMHANEVGLLCNMTMATLLFAGLGARGGLQRSIFLVAAGLMGVTSVLSFSRGAFVGALFVAGYFLISRRRFGQMLLSLVILAGVAMVLPDAAIERALTGLGDWGGPAFTAGRMDNIWLPLLPTVAASPVIGNGLSSVMWAPANVQGRMLPVGHPHSAYLGVLLDFGLVGVAIIGAFLVSMWRSFRRAREHARSPLWRGYFEGASVCLLLLLVQGITDDRFVPTYPQYLLWVAYGLSLASARRAALQAKPASAVDKNSDDSAAALGSTAPKPTPAGSSSRRW